MKHIIKTTLLSGCLLSVLVTAQAGIYKSVDEDGNVVYSQQPPKGAEYERMKVKTKPSSSAAEELTDSEQADPATSILNEAERSQKQKAATAEAMAKAEETRKKNCEVAKQNLYIYTTFRRITEKDGSSRYLDDNERAQKIEESKKMVAEFCD